MDFFEHQERAHRKSSWLVFYFVAAVVTIVIGVYLAFVLVFAGAKARGQGLRNANPQLWQPELFVAVAAGTLVVVVSGTLYKVWELSQGGEAVASMLGGRQVDPGTKGLQERKLLNVVEEMAIASGVPVPPVYLLEDEGSINAFAAGYSPGDAVIGATRGCMELLTRDELQGVIAHEFSHILNGDMRLNIRLIGVLNGILIIGILGYATMRSVMYAGAGRRHRSSRSDRGGGGTAAIFALGLLLTIIGYVGVFFGKLIKSAVSRQREYLADASSVQFTRNPSGLAGALRKIGGWAQGSRVENEHAEEASHLFFGNAMRASFLSALATHPPLAERIRRIDPSFDGEFPDVGRLAGDDTAAGTVPREPARAAVSGLAAAPGEAGATLTRLDPETVVQRVGAPEAQHLLYAERVVSSIPESVLACVREPYGARAVVCALLFDRDEGIARRQDELLAEHAEPTVYAETRKLLPAVGALSPHSRLPLVDLAIPALQQLSPAQYEAFRSNVRLLVEADEAVDVFEYALQRVLMRNLDSRLGRSAKTPVRYHSLSPLRGECALLLSTLARVGQDEDGADRAAQAFAAGASRLGLPAGTLTLLPSDQCGLGEVDTALERLSTAAPPLKRRLISACAATIAADRQVTVLEGELLRAVAASLDCPVPPLLAEAA